MEEDGDGFINMVYRISDGTYHLIVKQSTAEPRCKGDFTLDVNRFKLEYESMQIRKAIVPDLIPDLYDCDDENRIFITEDVSRLRISRFQLLKGLLTRFWRNRLPVIWRPITSTHRSSIWTARPSGICPCIYEFHHAGYYGCGHVPHQRLSGRHCGTSAGSGFCHIFQENLRRPRRSFIQTEASSSFHDQGRVSDPRRLTYVQHLCQPDGGKDHRYGIHVLRTVLL